MAVEGFGGFNSARALRKWVNNNYYMADQCQFISAPDGHLETFPDTWAAAALRLFFERYRITRPNADASELINAANKQELHKLLGVQKNWLDGILPGAADMFLSAQDVVFTGSEETKAERKAVISGVPVPSDAETRRRETTIQQIIRRTDNRRFLQQTYGGCCQVSGVKLTMPDGSFSTDCAHIRPLGVPHSGRDNVDNMLSLSPTVHRLFDRGCIRIDPDTLRISLLYGNDIPHLPHLDTHPTHGIDKENLKYHLAHIIE
jgi:hypothetical protein